MLTNTGSPGKFSAKSRARATIGRPGWDGYPTFWVGGGGGTVVCGSEPPTQAVLCHFGLSAGQNGHMTAKEVQQIVDETTRGHLDAVAHGMSLREALVSPHKIDVIDRRVLNGKIVDTITATWVVARERVTDGYTIVLDDKTGLFGLATSGFPNDKHPVVSGWYRGDLVDTFLGI